MRWSAAVAVCLLAAPSVADDRWPTAGVDSAVFAQPNAVQCAETALDPGDCASVTVVSDVASLDTCMEAASPTVCFVDQTIRVTDSTAGSAAFEWNLVENASTEKWVVCRDGAGLVANYTTPNPSRNIVEANGNTSGMRFGVSGCRIWEERNGVPGGGTGSVEGLVFKVPTDFATTEVFNVVYKDTTVYNYSTGTSSIGCGANPTAATHVLYDNTTCYGPIGGDLKQHCTGCDTPVIFARNSRFIGNDAVAGCRSVKIDEDASIVFEGTAFVNCPISLDSDATGADGGDILFAGSGNVALNMRSANAANIIQSGGGSVDFEYRSVTGLLRVYDSGVSELLQISSVGVLRLDLTFDFARCPASTLTEYYDQRALNASALLGYVRIIIKVPQGCTMLSAAALIAGTGAEAEFDTKLTRVFVKVSNGTAANVSQMLGDGAGPTTTTTDFPLADDAPGSLEVRCSGRTAEATPDAADLDTGDEISAYCGARCLGVREIDGADTAVAACTTDTSAVGNDVAVWMD